MTLGESADSASLGRMIRERGRRALSDREREAAALLFEDGWTKGELTLTFQVSENALRKALIYEGVYRPARDADSEGDR